MAIGSCWRPIPATDQRAALGQIVDEIGEVLNRRLQAARDAEHEIDVLRKREQSFAREPPGVGDVPLVEDLQLGPHAELVHLLENAAHDRKAVLEDVVAEVDAAAGQRRHLGSKLQDARAFFRRHSNRAAGRKLNDQIALRTNRLLRLAKAFDAMSIRAVVVAAVHVNHRTAGVAHGARRFAEELRRVRQIRRLVGAHLCADRAHT